MRFVELAIEAFQALERGSVQLGPGLNVLYGPNDLGKSTLAGAIRAALFVQPKAADAQRYTSWYADAIPRVALTFTDDQDRYWQIKKAFGGGGSAELLHSKDGKEFHPECKAREVEEKVRALLSWGIPAPGGRSAPRGLPDSFLAKVLLAAQTDVDDILGASLEKDPDDSGKVRLRKALATLAQDPLFKRVLDTVQQEYDVNFTATGRLRRTQGSKLIAADELVKKHLAEIGQLTHEREQSREIEDQVRALREACSSAEIASGDAEAALAVTRTGVANARQRAAAQAQLTAAEQTLAEIDAQAARLQTLERQTERLRSQVTERRRALEQAGTESERLEAAQRVAEDAVRSATSDAAEQARKLRAAELSSEAAQLTARATQLEARRSEVRRASQALDAKQAAALALEASRHKLGTCTERLTEARASAQHADEERDLARCVLAYGRWRAAQDVAERSEQTRRSLQSLTAQAAAIDAEAKSLREQHARRALELAERRSKLPVPERLTQLDALQKDLEIAEAALGGGLSIKLTPRRKDVSLRATIDRVPAGEAQTLASELVIEAQRSAHLVVADLVEIEVSAGAAEQRHAVAELRQRWQNEVAPVLAQAAVGALSSLESAVAALRLEDETAQALLRQAETRTADARSTRERAELIAKQLENQEPYDVAARRAAIGSISLELLEPRWRKLGAQWEPRAETERERSEQQQAAARERCSKLEQEQQLASYQLSEAESAARERGREAEALAAALAGRDAIEVSQALEAELCALVERKRAIDQALEALSKEAGAARVKAEQALVAARAACEGARTTRDAAQRALELSNAELNTTIGEATAQAQQLERMDRPAVTLRLQQCAVQLQACPSEPLASEVELSDAETALARARRAFDERREDLHKAEGALTKVGGAQLQDRLQQEQEALETAQLRERELKVDADAWKLLREALRAAETADSEHLGSALGRPVGDKLRELTGGRYTDLCFDQHMTADRLKASGATPDADVLEALSVGTRNQLATLVRLTIASQLKSAIILDDHLVHTDPTRLGWFRDMLRKTALDTQVLVLTCRPEDYLAPSELPTTNPLNDLAGGTVRAIDLTRVLRRWPAATR